MIDKVRLKRRCNLDISRFNQRRFTYDTQMFEEEEYRYYKYNCSGVTISYSTRSSILAVEGRLINLSVAPNRVDTLDMLWAGIEPSNSAESENLEDILDRLNNTLLDLTGYRMDISRFTVSYIEICFNIRTEHVGSYLHIFNETFKYNNKSRYTNYITMARKDWQTGFYIKTKKDYAMNSKHNCVINFYDKYNQLCDMQEKNKSDKYSAQASPDDLERARNILRLELQGRNYFCRNIREKYSISGLFGDFLDIDLCRNLVADKYRSFIDRYTYCDFHTYRSALEVISRSELFTGKQKTALKEYCLLLSRRNHLKKNRNTRRKYEDMLSQLHIHSMLMQPRCVGSEDILPSPMALLDEHVQRMKEQRQSYMEHHGISEYRVAIQEEIPDDFVDLGFDDMEDIFGEHEETES